MEEIKCTYCGEPLGSEEKENPYYDEDDDIMCDDCYSDYYMNTCCLCEDDYKKPTKPEELYFVISKECKNDVGIENIKPGIYQTTSWPYYLGATALGFQSLFENSIKLIKELDINSMLKKLYGKHHEEIRADEICEFCVKKYTSNKYVFTHWTDKHTRIHRNIYEREIIKQGY
jgi:hypothetical protein